MKATNANQRLARELAERHDTGYDARARELRAENARRAKAATVTRIGDRNLEWLDRATRSVPAYEVLA